MKTPQIWRRNMKKKDETEDELRVTVSWELTEAQDKPGLSAPRKDKVFCVMLKHYETQQGIDTV